MSLVTKPSGRKSTNKAEGSIVYSAPAYHIGVNKYAIELVDANKFIRPSKLPAGASEQAEKDLIIPENLL